jgi:hypothetical protein
LKESIHGLNQSRPTGPAFTGPTGVKHGVLVREYQDGTGGTHAEYLDAASNT